MKRALFALTLCLPLVFVSCEKDDDDDPVPTTPTTPTNPTNPTNPPANQRPDSYIVIDGDSFFLTSNQVTFSTTVFRYQFNFSSVAQLDQTDNDGGTPATIGLGLTRYEKPTTSGQDPFSSSRFPTMGSTDINFYMSFFVNTGHPQEDKNFLTPDNGMLDYTINGSTFTSTLPAITLTDEADNTNTVDLSAGYIQVDNW